MAYNPGRLDLIGDMLKGVQIAHGLETLAQARKQRETSETASTAAAESVTRTPMTSPVGDTGMSVNMGDKLTFNPQNYINKLRTSGNPDLVIKAGEFEQQYANIAATTQNVKKAQQETAMLNQTNELNIIGTAIDLADDDPDGAGAMITQHNRDTGDERETVDRVVPLGNNKYRLIGTDSEGKAMNQVVDKNQVLQARTEANTRWVQYNENLRQQARLAAEKEKTTKDKSGPEYLDVTAPDTGAPGRMKAMDMVDIYRKTHPTASADDMEYLTLKMRASFPGASPELQDQLRVMDQERGDMASKYAEWAWNTYKADPLGLINMKGPIPWMGAKLPPAGLMRGKALYDNKTRSWKISNGEEWLRPNDKQQKQIDAQAK